MTDEQKAKYMSVIKVYGYKKILYNRFGDRIQEWDTYGIKNAVRSGTIEEVIFTAYGSNEESAMLQVDKFKQENLTSKIEVMKNKA